MEVEPRPLHPETVRLVKATCLRKKRYLSRSEAQRAAWGLREVEEAGNLRAYRCPYGSEQEHWHVGHPPSMEDLEAIARSIRDLHGNRPEVVES